MCIRTRELEGVVPNTNRLSIRSRGSSPRTLYLSMRVSVLEHENKGLYNTIDL